MKALTSFGNAAVRRYRGLDDPRERRATGLATAEGIKVLGEALLSDADLVQVFLSERASRSPEGEDLAARLEAGEATGRWECYAVPDDLLGRMASTEQPQGALAVFRPRAFTPADALAAGGPVLLLDRVADPGNVGLILRTAEAAGAGGVFLSPGCADHLNPKAVRASAGTVFRLPAVRSGLESAAAAAGGAGFRLHATSPRRGEEYTDADLAGKVGFLLGAEGSGLPSGIEERFGALHIPTARVESLNVAMAAGILLFEARRQRAAARRRPAAGRRE